MPKVSFVAVLTPDCCVSCGDVLNAPDANTTRASLEVARVALERMMGAPTAAGAPRDGPVTMAVRASDAWNSSESFLRCLSGRADLDGQALLAEARRAGTLDMDGMHALVALREWVERTLAPGSAAQILTLPPTHAEREVASNALAALKRAVSDLAASDSAVGDRALVASEPAVSRSGGTPEPASSWSPGPPPVRSAPPLATAHKIDRTIEPATSAPGNAGGKRSMSSGMIIGVALLIIALTSTSLFFRFRGRASSTSSTDEGAAAYARGAKEAARIAFVKAIADNPDDARALTYLGRISREQGSMATARLYLEKAIRIDPNNALASRELGSALLADQQYELARRFYVRALTLDSADRVSQGFLGCSLIKLNRNEEAQRWLDRAGTGEWSGCVSAPMAPPAKD